MTSSATVAAVENSSTALPANFEIKKPPIPNTRTMAGTMHDKISASFHCLMNAMIKPEQNVAIEARVMESYRSFQSFPIVILPYQISHLESSPHHETGDSKSRRLPHNRRSQCSVAIQLVGTTSHHQWPLTGELLSDPPAYTCSTCHPTDDADICGHKNADTDIDHIESQPTYLSSDCYTIG